MRKAGILMFLTAIVCFTSKAELPKVQCAGELRNVMMHDDRTTRVALDQLVGKNLFALGLAENIDGEITVVDGDPRVSRVSQQGEVTVVHDASAKSPFLVSANVAQWQSLALEAAPQSIHELAAMVEVAAKKQGLDTEQAFPFLIKGRFSELSYHIVRGADANGQRVPGGERVPFVVKNVSATLLGFFSKHHQGVFTHKDSFVHVHFVASSPELSGHVEELKLETAVLSLPKP